MFEASQHYHRTHARKESPLNQQEQSSYEVTEWGRRQHAQDLHGSVPGPQCAYDGFQFSIFFLRFLRAHMSEALLLVPSLDLFSFFVCFVQLWCAGFYFVFYFILLLCLRELWFIMIDKKEMGPDKMGGRRERAGV